MKEAHEVAKEKSEHLEYVRGYYLAKSAYKLTAPIIVKKIKGEIKDPFIGQLVIIG